MKLHIEMNLTRSYINMLFKIYDTFLKKLSYKYDINEKAFVSFISERESINFYNFTYRHADQSSVSNIMYYANVDSLRNGGSIKKKEKHTRLSAIIEE